MITLKDSIKINAKPEEVFEGLIKVFSTQEYFQKWHEDHVKCYWIKGENFEEGSIIYLEQYMRGKLQKMKLQSTKIELNRRIEYKPLFPASIISPKGSFIVEPENGSSIFTATTSFRFGWLFKKFAQNRIEVFTTHIKKEGENLKKIVENKI